MSIKRIVLILLAAIAIGGWLFYDNYSPLGTRLVARDLGGAFWSRDSKSLYYPVGQRGNIVCYDVETGKRAAFSIPQQYCESYTSRYEDRLIAGVTRDAGKYRLYTYDLKSGKETTIFQATKKIWNARLLKENVICFEQEGSIYLIDGIGNKPERIIRGVSCPVYGCDDESIAYHYSDKFKECVRVYDLVTRQTTSIPIERSAPRLGLVYLSRQRAVFINDPQYSRYAGYVVTSYSLRTLKKTRISIPLKGYRGCTEVPPSISPDLSKYIYSTIPDPRQWRLTPPRLYLADVPAEAHKHLAKSD